jgi:hypothetical protein
MDTNEDKCERLSIELSPKPRRGPNGARGAVARERESRAVFYQHLRSPMFEA